MHYSIATTEKSFRELALATLGMVLGVLAVAGPARATDPMVEIMIGPNGGQSLNFRETDNYVNKTQVAGPITVTVREITGDNWRMSLSIADEIVIPERDVQKDSPIIHSLTKRPNEGALVLSVKLTNGDKNYEFTYRLLVDTQGPKVIDHYVTGDPKIGLLLNLVFKESDFGNVTNANIAVVNEFADKPLSPIGTPTAEGHIIRIPLNQPPVGTYRVTVKGEGADALKDRAGNPADNGKDQIRTFTTTAQSEPGKHVEFPRFVPAKQLDQGEFNPGDFVETRVARLYYYRDAHRVAQIINRTARPLRAAEVSQAERRAADARGEADRLTDQRRDTEMRAEEVGRRLRAAEQRLSQAQEMLNQKVDESTTPIASTPGTPAPPGRRDPTETEKAEITKLERTVADLRREYRGLQDEAAQLRLQTQQHQAHEDRAREKQFRLEVASAHEDPDTYAAAKLDSPDPVSQVSVSVIGEGLIQLRGPIAGINKIRTMIDQIDSPLGQVRVDVITVQLNGEDGHRLEEPVGRVNGYIDLGRFLTSQSLAYLRRAIQTEAARVAADAYYQYQGNYQVDRDRRYLYSFFGRDFIDELYEMDSEFLHTENKLLSLHSMDTLSLNQALFILSLARRDIRANILATFQASIQEELPQAEWDYRRSAGLIDKHHALVSMIKNKHRSPEPRCLEEVFVHAAEKYHFRNFTAMFDGNDTYSGDPDIMTPLQREFLRLAQIFKARMVAEVEIKQRVIERGLIENKRQDSFNEEERLKAELRKKVISITEDLQDEGFRVAQDLAVALAVFESNITTNSNARHHASSVLQIAAAVQEAIKEIENNDTKRLQQRHSEIIRSDDEILADTRKLVAEMFSSIASLQSYSASISGDETLRNTISDLNKKTTEIFFMSPNHSETLAESDLTDLLDSLRKAKIDSRYQLLLQDIHDQLINSENQLVFLVSEFRRSANPLVSTQSEVNTRMVNVHASYAGLKAHISEKFPKQQQASAQEALKRAYDSAINFLNTLVKKSVADHFLVQTRINVDHKKLLDFLIDEKEDKFIELQEGTRAHIAWMDNYLKRLAIALEDDFKVQFYEPAFVRIRSNARTKFVTLSQIERTSILTNNRAFGKVTPQATMEFDLPKRKLALVEAFDAAKAVAQDAGALLNDPTFLATFQMMGGGPVGTQVQGVLPSLPSSTDQAIMGITSENQRDIGAALQALVPPPAIYKFETGTGYEIRPVIQPDGHSILFDFLYMYTTNVREPVGGDEKHLGRVRRHFIDTQVQLSSFEMRELSRYQVALKVARTAQGVPLLQDIPLLGVAFRPLPSKESSIQQNVILGQTVVYPTLFDLMGLRWAPAVIDLNHTDLRNQNHVVRGRNRAMEDAVFRMASENVDEMLDLHRRSPSHVRPDLYHPQRTPSPYHPNGYRYDPNDPNFVDPTGQQFEQPDRRPTEFQTPPYDSRFRRPVRIEAGPPPNAVKAPSAALHNNYYESQTGLEVYAFPAARTPDQALEWVPTPAGELAPVR